MSKKLTITDHDGKEVPLKKGDGKKTCEWCGDTGWMNTFGNDGRKLGEAPCICKKGEEVRKSSGWGK